MATPAGLSHAGRVPFRNPQLIPVSADEAAAAHHIDQRTGLTAQQLENAGDRPVVRGLHADLMAVLGQFLRAVTSQ
jgi:hypothetical protein